MVYFHLSSFFEAVVSFQALFKNNISIQSIICNLSPNVMENAMNFKNPMACYVDWYDPNCFGWVFRAAIFPVSQLSSRAASCCIGIGRYSRKIRISENTKEIKFNSNSGEVWISAGSNNCELLVGKKNKYIYTYIYIYLYIYIYI